MRVPINLASEPFRRDRSTLVLSAVIAAILIVLAAGQAFLILGERARAAENRTTVENLNNQLRLIAAEQTKNDGVMRENAAVLQQSVMLNTLIERKSVSWTKLFADVESVLPNNVRLIQIRLPQINSRNQITLDMEVGSKQPADANEFFINLEKSPLFGAMTPLRYEPPNDQDPLNHYRVTVSYGQK